jgi:anti-sigma B factor antagonist
MATDGDSARSSEAPHLVPAEHWHCGVAIRREVRGTAVVIRIRGDIDVVSAGTLDDRLAAAERLATPSLPLIVDLSQVAFLGARGLRVLVDHHRRCEANRVVLAIVAGHRAVLLPMEITRLDRYLRLYPSLAVAVAAESTRDDSAPANDRDGPA